LRLDFPGFPAFVNKALLIRPFRPGRTQTKESLQQEQQQEKKRKDR